MVYHAKTAARGLDCSLRDVATIGRLGDTFHDALNPMGPAKFCKEGLNINLTPNQLRVLEGAFTPGISELILLSGKGSGKDFLCSVMAAYQIYRLLILPSPQRYYGLAEGSPIDIIVVGSTERQARRVFYSQFKEILWRSPWFLEFIDDMPPPNSDVFYFPKGVRVATFHSGVDSFEGLNLMFAILDEFSAFRSTTKKTNAEVIYSKIKTSIISRFGLNGHLAIISYPRPPWETDPTVAKYEESKLVDWAIGHKFCTWEMHPKTTREDLEEFYVRDPELARMTFECKRPMISTKDQFFPRDLVERSTTGPRYCKTKQYVHGSRVKLDVKNLPTFPVIVGMDPGLSNDSFVLALAHPVEDMFVIEDILGWEPQTGLPVDFSDVLSVLLELDISSISTDSWNSAFLMQILEDRGISGDVKGFKRDAQARYYQDLKEMMNMEEIQLPDIVPLRRQLLSIEKDKEGKIHVPNRREESKDYPDSIVLAIASWRDTGGATGAPTFAVGE
jgi:hypothetical protein